MAIPDSLLRKPDTLTPEDTAIIQQHPYRGYQMRSKIPFLAGAAETLSRSRDWRSFEGIQHESRAQGLCESATGGLVDRNFGPFGSHAEMRSKRKQVLQIARVSVPRGF